VRSWAYSLTIPVEPASLMVPAEIAFNHDTFCNGPIMQRSEFGFLRELDAAA
jgi:hypothetical protein